MDANFLITFNDSECIAMEGRASMAITIVLALLAELDEILHPAKALDVGFRVYFCRVFLCGILYMVDFLKKHEPANSNQIGAKIQKKKRCVCFFPWNFGISSYFSYFYQLFLIK